MEAIRFATNADLSHHGAHAGPNRQVVYPQIEQGAPLATESIFQQKHGMLRYYIRIGSLAEIHVADSESALATGRRVIVRTARGVELGTVAAIVGHQGASRPTSVRVLRPTTQQDELLLRRLERHKRQAVEACRDALRACGSNAALLEVDQIFDGGTLVMHFLGPVDERSQAATELVVEQYESVVRSRHFAKLLVDGCGPDCGTGESAGCGSAGGGCGQCGIAKACKPAP